jgi:hypothetical protein
MLLLTAMGAIGGACGDDEPNASSVGTDSRAQSSSRAEAPAATMPDTTDASATTEPEDGRLTTTTGTVITDYGDRGQRVAAVQALDRLQQDFRASRMAAACKRISDFMLSQFTPAGTQGGTSCPKKLEAYANARAQRGDSPKRLRLLWVRQYTGQAGVWVEEPDGNRLRIQLSQPLSGGGWQLDLGSLSQPDVLAAKLASADQYGAH